MTDRDRCNGCTRREALLELTVMAAALAGCGSSGGSSGADTTAALDTAAPQGDLGAPEPEDTAAPPDLSEPMDTAEPPPPDVAEPDAGPEACATNVCIDLADAKNAKLAAVGGTGQVTIGSDKVIVVHLDETTYAALSSVCTHNGCKVAFQKTKSNLRCPCHGSVFELDGSVTTGPALKPLKVYATELNGDVLIVHKA